jgi:hypothetical protein
MKQTPALGARGLSIKLNSLPEALAMNDSASRTCSGLSRTTRRTRTLVSTARMLLADVFIFLAAFGQARGYGQLPTQSAPQEATRPTPTKSRTDSSFNRRYNALAAAESAVSEICPSNSAARLPRTLEQSLLCASKEPFLDRSSPNLRGKTGVCRSIRAYDLPQSQIERIASNLPGLPRRRRES